VNDGTIDAIVSGHQPQDRESKFLEFDLASPGVISLQTVFSVLMSLKGELDLEAAIDRLTHGARKILGLETATIQEGAQARLAFFDPEKQWTLNKKSNQSKSENSPFWETELNGRTLGIVIGNKLELND